MLLLSQHISHRKTRGFYKKTVNSGLTASVFLESPFTQSQRRQNSGEKDITCYRSTTFKWQPCKTCDIANDIAIRKTRVRIINIDSLHPQFLKEDYSITNSRVKVLEGERSTLERCLQKEAELHRAVGFVTTLLSGALNPKRRKRCRKPTTHEYQHLPFHFCRFNTKTL